MEELRRDRTATLVRFLIGLVLGGAFVIWGGVPLIMGLLLAVGMGVLTSIWGDHFVVWLIRLSRLFVR